MLRPDDWEAYFVTDKRRFQTNRLVLSRVRIAAVIHLITRLPKLSLPKLARQIVCTIENLMFNSTTLSTN